MIHRLIERQRQIKECKNETKTQRERQRFREIERD